MLATLTQTVIAQQEKGLTFTSLDWEEMRIDSVLPVYTEVVPLETYYRTHAYTVSLLYPEYAALSAKEAKVAEQFDSLVSETIDVETFVGVRFFTKLSLFNMIVPDTQTANSAGRS